MWRLTEEQPKNHPRQCTRKAITENPKQAHNVAATQPKTLPSSPLSHLPPLRAAACCRSDCCHAIDRVIVELADEESRSLSEVRIDCWKDCVATSANAVMTVVDLADVAVLCEAVVRHVLEQVNNTLECTLSDQCVVCIMESGAALLNTVGVRAADGAADRVGD